LAITGTVDSFTVSLQGGHAAKDGGLIPQVKITQTDVDIDPTLDIQLVGSVIGWVIDLIEPLLGPVKKLIINEVESALGKDPAIRQQISDGINGELVKVYPTNVPVAPYPIAISTFVTDDFVAHDKGVEVRGEGIVYPTATGHKRYSECKPLTSKIDFTDDSHDLTVLVGECTALSVIDSVAESGIQKTTNISIEGKSVPVTLSLKQWDQTSVDFSPGSCEAKAKVGVSATVLGINLQLDADITADMTLTKVEKLHYTGPTIKQMNKVYSPIVENAWLGTWDLDVHVKTFSINNCPSVASSVCAEINKVISAAKYTHEFKIPQVRITDGVVVSSLDLTIYDGHAMAHGSVAME